jgi:arylsulfatase A-like enzyme
MMSRRNGLDRGYQWWTERTRANLASTLPGVFDAIGVGPAKPLFLTLHTYDIHGPYAYLPGVRDLRVGARAGSAERPRARCWASSACDSASEWERVRSNPYHDYQRFERFEGLPDAVDAYDVGIRFVDIQLGRLFARLRDVGILDNSMVIITSDHGESLYERALYLGHSYTLHDEEVRVPLVVRLPDGARGRSDALVTLADVAASMLEQAGVPLPEGMEGRNPLRGASRTSVAGESVHTGRTYLRADGWKLISPVAPGIKSLLPSPLADRFDAGGQLYSHRDDPFEQHNRMATAPTDPGVAALLAELDGLPVPGRQNGGSAPALDAQQQQQLRELGYLR